MEKSENIINIFPYFNGEICKSVDSVILVQEVNAKNYYLFHIELKSKRPDDTEIFKKYISSIKMLNFILDILYLKYKEKSRNFKFPENIVNMPVLFFSEHNKKLKSQKKKSLSLRKSLKKNQRINLRKSLNLKISLLIKIYQKVIKISILLRMLMQKRQQRGQLIAMLK